MTCNNTATSQYIIPALSLTLEENARSVNKSYQAIWGAYECTLIFKSTQSCFLMCTLNTMWAVFPAYLSQQRAELHHYITPFNTSISHQLFSTTNVSLTCSCSLALLSSINTQLSPFLVLLFLLPALFLHPFQIPYPLFCLSRDLHLSGFKTLV